MYLGWRCYLGIPGYLDRGIAMCTTTTIHHPGMYLGWRCYLGIPGYLDRGIAMCTTTTIHHPGMYLGWRCYLGIPGYLDRGIAVHYHYHTPSRDVPGMTVLLGNPGILRQGYSCVLPLPYTIPGCTWDGGVTWESRDT